MSDIPSVAQTFFLKLNAAVTLIPVMNAEDMAKGVQKAAKHR